MSDLTKKYKIGLEYLRKTGFDHIVKEKGVFGTEIYKYKAHSRFDNEKEDLPNPCQFREFVLTKKLMDHYKIRTKVDIARYLRIISIILTNFIGTEKYDNFFEHDMRIKNHFDDGYYYQKEERRGLAIRDALIAYDETFSRKESIPLSDYLAFADVLNLFYSIYDPASILPKMKKDFFTLEKIKAIGETISKGVEKPKTTDDDIFDDYDSYDDYDSDDEEGSTSRELDISWVYDELFKDFTDKKLVEMIKDDGRRKTLVISLKEPVGIVGFSDSKLKELLNNKLERKKLVLKIRNWHSKNYPKKK